MKNNFQSKSIIKLNNQTWNGGTPNFINSLREINIKIFTPLKFINIETDIVTKKIIEPKDWIKKYFKPNNLGAGFEFINLTIGINNKRLISIILQIKKKFLIETPIIEVTIKNNIKKVFLNQAIF